MKKKTFYGYQLGKEKLSEVFGEYSLRELLNLPKTKGEALEDAQVDNRWNPKKKVKFIKITVEIEE